MEPKEEPKAVGEQVGELYAEYPYPAHGVISSVIPKLLRPLVEEQQKRLGRRALRYLDAGCGTGEQTLGVARTFPELEVVGVDLNRASLDLARGLADRNRLKARFERRSLMDPIDDLGPVDLVTSIGVLHSLPDPKRGFEVLRRLAHPDTAFLGMVYGTFGKWDLFQVRDALNLIAGDGTPRSERIELLRGARIANNHGPGHYLETLVRRARFGPAIRPVEALRRVLAGRNDAYQADSYTHVQEVTYTWAELIRLLDDAGWRFVGWPPFSGMPDRPEQVLKGAARDRVAAMPIAEQAAIYERLVRPPNLYFIARPK